MACEVCLLLDSFVSRRRVTSLQKKLHLSSPLRLQELSPFFYLTCSPSFKTRRRSHSKARRGEWECRSRFAKSYFLGAIHSPSILFPVDNERRRTSTTANSTYSRPCAYYAFIFAQIRLCPSQDASLLNVRTTKPNKHAGKTKCCLYVTILGKSCAAILSSRASLFVSNHSQRITFASAEEKR